MIPALGFAVVFVAAAAAAVIFRRGGLRALGQWHLDPNAPLVVRNLPFLMLPVAALGFTGLVMIGFISTTFLTHPLVTLVVTLALMAVFFGATWFALFPPEWLKPQWLRDATPPQPAPSTGPPAGEAPSAVVPASTAWAPPAPWRVPEGEGVYNGGRPAVTPPEVSPWPVATSSAGAETAPVAEPGTELTPAAAGDEDDAPVEDERPAPLEDERPAPLEDERPAPLEDEARAPVEEATQSWSWAGDTSPETASSSREPAAGEATPEARDTRDTDVLASAEPLPGPDDTKASGDRPTTEELAPTPRRQEAPPEEGRDADDAARRAGWG